MAWVDDGSESFTFEDNVAECTKDDGKFNAMWEDGEGVSEGEHYWELEVLEGDSMWFGITNKKNFVKGFRCRALAYCRDVSDGRSTVIGKFGPSLPKKGDTIGCLVEFTEEKFVVRFYHNGKCLGAAFEFEAPAPAAMYPVAILRKPGHKVQIEKKDAPEQREREALEPNEGVVGNWKAETATMESEEITMECLMNVKPRNDDGDLLLAADVGNKLRTTATKTETGYKGDVIQNTSMPVTDEQKNMEDAITKLFGRLENIELEGEELVITSEDGDMRCKPYVAPGPPAYTKNELRMGG